MKTQIVIPRTIKEAGAKLSSLDALSRATEWERAAIVYAFTKDGGQGSYQQNLNSEVLGTESFAGLGFAGLRSGNTVREYRKNWQWAIDNGMAVVVKPGDALDGLPTIGYPPSPRKHSATADEVEASVAKAIKDNPEKVVKALVTEARGALVNTIAEMPAVGDEVTEATAAVRAKRAMPRSGPVLKTDRVLQVVMSALNEFWDREVQAGPNRMTFQQVVETVIENAGSPTLRSHSVPTAHLGNELMDALRAHIEKSEDIRDGKTLKTTGVALVGKGAK